MQWVFAVQDKEDRQTYDCVPTHFSTMVNAINLEMIELPGVRPTSEGWGMGENKGDVQSKWERAKAAGDVFSSFCSTCAGGTRCTISVLRSSEGCDWCRSG